MRATIMCDASWCPETGAAGYGFWIASDRGKQPGGGQFRDIMSTAAEAEMGAVVNSLVHARNLNLLMPGDWVLVQTDCVEAIAVLSGRREPLTRLAENIRDALQLFLNKHKILVTFKHVKGHSRNKQARFLANNHCDTRAKGHMRDKRKELRSSPGSRLHSPA